MKYTLIFAAVIATAFADCPAGYFSQEAGGPCNFACSEGCKDGCNSVGGACTTINDCKDGWTNAPQDLKMGIVENGCSVPVCFGKAGCQNGGECIAPNTCICGKSGAQVVSKAVEDENGNFQGYDCISLRADGIKGAFIALVVMLVSITTCGFIAEKNGQAK